MTEQVFVVVAQYGYEGLGIESVWAEVEAARVEMIRLNLAHGDDHQDCGPDGCDCTCRYRVYTYDLRS